MYNILFIDSSSANADLLRQYLSSHFGEKIQLTYLNNLANAFAFLKTHKMHLIIISTAFLIQPIVKELLTQKTALIIQGLPNEKESCINWIESGFQDFFSLREISSTKLMQIITFALARQKHLNLLHDLSLTDEVTQCYNRRGFDLLLTQQIGISTRMNRNFILFYMDVDGLKKINDHFGHARGDCAIKDISIILHQSFRLYDIIGRIGGDEFAVCAIDTKAEQIPIFEEKIQKNIEIFKKEQKREYPLSISMGTTIFDPKSPVSMEQLYLQADHSLYHSKRSLRAF